MKSKHLIKYDFKRNPLATKGVYIGLMSNHVQITFWLLIVSNGFQWTSYVNFKDSTVLKSHRNLKIYSI